MSRILPIRADGLWRSIRRELAYLAPEKIPEALVNLYDDYAREAFDKYYLAVAREIVCFCPKGRILDIGCGPGYLAIQVARLSENTFIEGVDLSPEMVRLAENNATKYGIEKRVKFRVGNANELDCRDADYDMVVSTGVLHSLRDPVQFLNECFRVLKPGRQAWIYDPAKITSGPPSLSKAGDWAKVVVYLGVMLFAKVFQKGNLSEKDLLDIINKSRFSECSISVHGDIRLKLRKKETEV